MHHHNTIPVNQPTRCNNFPSLLQCCWSWLGRSARPWPTALLPPRSNGKTRGCHCSCCAPDDGHEDARNML